MASNLGSILFFCAAVGIAVCSIMAYYGFQGRITTIGVDLGTTLSVVGYKSRSVVTIVTDVDGNSLFPSIVSYGDDGEIYTLHDALKRLEDHPYDTIFNAKRFIGRSLDEEVVKSYAEHHPFQVVDITSLGISNYSTIGFNVTKNHRIVTPEEVGSSVLKGLLKVTSLFLGHNQVKKAVIAVPAKFNDQQRAATGLAYKLAGLKVVRVIEEPTAAAVAYQLHKKSNIHHILVYDFGGGTLDVSILYVAQGSVQVYATDGDETLGGSDLDVCLQEYIISKLPADSMTNAHIPTIRLLAERAKKSLSSDDVAHLVVPLSEAKYSIAITRSDFETACSSIFDRALIPVLRLLEELKMSPNDIDEVVLVGGTTRIPKVKIMLKLYFGKELNDHIDPDITVAYGAASILD